MAVIAIQASQTSEQVSPPLTPQDAGSDSSDWQQVHGDLWFKIATGVMELPLRDIPTTGNLLVYRRRDDWGNPCALFQEFEGAAYPSFIENAE